MSGGEDSFVILGDETVDVYSSFDGSVAVENSVIDDDVFASSPQQQQIYGGEYTNGGGINGSDGPILPPPSEMEHDEAFALREWRRQNALQLEEKEKREKELLGQIIDEAERYKAEFYKKREITCENNKTTNREKEKVFQAQQEKFYAEVNKNYWKAIADLIPNEVPAIEKRRGKKDQEKKPSIAVVQGPKPGKPTDLARMRQILLKLKHNPPPHLKPVSPPAPAATPPKDVPAAAPAEAVVAA